MSETRERSALDLLRELEWAGTPIHGEQADGAPVSFARCHFCRRNEEGGHAPDCALDAVLRATPASDGGEVRGDAPAGATLYRRRCGWCGAYEGTVDPKEPCAKDEIGYIGPHQFEVLEAVVSGSGTPPGEGEALRRFAEDIAEEAERYSAQGWQIDTRSVGVRARRALRSEAQGEEDAVRRTWELAVQRAYGCLDYCGGYRGAEELKAFHSGIKTVIRALEAGPDTVDTQTAALDRIGAALRSAPSGVEDRATPTDRSEPK